MIVKENPGAAKKLLSRVRSERPPRTPGLHASDVLHCLRKSWHRHEYPELYAEGGRYAEDDESTVIFLLGESAHIFLGGKTDSEKSLNWEGLSCTPDEASKDDNEFWPPIKEFKTTRRSSSKGLDKLPVYVEQAAIYCLAKGVNEASIFVIHSAGNYKFGDAKTFVNWFWYDVTFTDLELAWWKREVLRRRDVLLSAKKFTDIPLRENWDSKWEASCKYCPLLDNECPGNGGEWQPAFPNIQWAEKA
jgi:hypothetical protein